MTPPVVNDFTVDIVDTLESVGRGSWDALAASRSFYVSYDWLRHVEQDRDAECWYLVARCGDGDVAGALPVYRVNRETNAAYDVGIVFGGTENYLLAGGRRGYLNEVIVDAALEPPRQRAIVEALLAQAERHARDLGLDGVAFLYLTTDAAELIHSASSRCPPLLHSMDAVLPLADGYLASLQPRKAYTVRKEMRKFEEASYETGIENLADCWRECGPLLANVQHRYGHPDSAEACTAMLHAQAQVLSEYSRVFTARRNGVLVAYALCFQWQEGLYGRLVGFDYDELAAAGEYFNLYYYEPIRHAEVAGLTSFRLGRSSYEAKLRRGATLHALWAVLLDDSTASGDRQRENGLRIAKWQEELGAAAIDLPTSWS